MTPYWQDDTVTLHLGKAEAVLPTLPDASVDAVVCDPPAGVRFMNKAWDSDMGGRHSWVNWLAGVMAEAHRCLKPGGHALVWALPRTSHWTAWALEDAGFEIRDCVLHLFGQGFAKSLDVGKAIDRAAGAEREVVGQVATPFKVDAAAERGTALHGSVRGDFSKQTDDAGYRYTDVTAPATEDAKRWDGWGTALKPGQEMWWLARKPFKSSVAANVLTYGTGGINVDGCRVEGVVGYRSTGGFNSGGGSTVYGNSRGVSDRVYDQGRWPTNLVLTHGDCFSCECGQDGEPGVDHAATDDCRYDARVCDPSCPVAELNRQSGVIKAHDGNDYRGGRTHGTGQAATYLSSKPTGRHHGDSGGASRYYPVFRYEPKAPTHERPKLPDGTAHPTVKPLDLMRWLVRLVTSPGGTVLDMFAGTGTTGEACVIEGFRCVLVEQDPVNAEMARTRLRKPIQPTLGVRS